ncbi:hypothetical protein DL96DRAFT_1535638 [Flagelloscypha sp. PMI_526]|nr:hypothetical protein DL96DRAFT_1535638 [Flagelloscypha sp. PMI_526]
MTLARQEKFFSVGLDIGQSFEEIRCNDYLKSFTATGQPPQPVPQEPTSAALRQAQGLPPLFEPYTPAGDGSTGTALLASTSASAIVDPAQLPVIQNFKAVPVDPINQTLLAAPTLKSETYQSVSAMPEYSNFSPEELRYYAYLQGRKDPPPGTTMAPFIRPSPSPVGGTPSILFSGSGTGSPTASNPSGNEQFQAISALEQFNKHSLEELRVAWMQAGRPPRDITSAELSPTSTAATPGPVTASTSNPFGPANPFAPATSSPLARPPVTATAAPIFGGQNPVRPW